MLPGGSRVGGFSENKGFSEITSVSFVCEYSTPDFQNCQGYPHFVYIISYFLHNIYESPNLYISQQLKIIQYFEMNLSIAPDISAQIARIFFVVDKIFSI